MPMPIAERMSALPPYFSAAWFDVIQRARAGGRDIIRMDVGSPDMPPPPPVIAALAEAAANPSGHGYPPAGGTLAYRQAWAGYYQRRFNVALNPANQVEGLIGSKEGIFHAALALLNPGDLVLVPDPGYSPYERGARFAGAGVEYLPLRPENGFLPDLDAISPASAARARLLWLNYPNNPTGATADLAFFQRVIDFARQHDILVLHDAPYVDVVFGDYLAPSILEVPGALDHAVEFNSLSKMVNMAGWRAGVAVGQTAAIAALHTLKSNLDSSMFLAIQHAATVALDTPRAWIDERNAIYTARRDRVLAAFEAMHLTAATPRAGMYVYARLPDGVDAYDYTERLIMDTGVSTTYGEAFGPAGKGFIRVSLGTPDNRLNEALRRWQAWHASQ